MKIVDERTNCAKMNWFETTNGEVYEFSIPIYSHRPFIGMVISDDSFILGPEEDSLLIIDLEAGYGISIRGRDIEYIKKLETELAIKMPNL